ncbi:Rne/Rng family ribonuclease [Tessaracoccus antarcticus]|uniref:Ribonuclease E n=1 Tax=Tessaracoccus antarcticus TaxID=2479848 RepID=A0A3M0G9K3_9ACTN|nr:Rne/Rng family ribonuclease [Tessaracoccus antarcticus]RMB57789.1 Rne/Rng family ribonuclease [Tessaracoccus antarcticus]
MLENENGTTPAESTPQPPVRRRAASRPAGPPPEVAAPAPADVPRTAAAQPDPATGGGAAAGEAPTATRSRRATRPTGAVTETAAAAPTRSRSRAKAAPVADEPAQDAADTVETVAERPRRTRRATSAVKSPEVPAAAEAAPVDEEKPVTRSRRASRPAAAPVPEPVAEQAPEPVAEVVTVTEPAAEEKPPTRRRRASSRPAAAPDSETAAAASPETGPEKADPAPAAQEEAAAEEKPATRRRRATRGAAPAATEAPTADDNATSSTSDVGAALDALTAEIASGKPEAVTDEKPSRRRRATRSVTPAPVQEAPAAQATDEDVPEMDGIAAALRMAEDAARTRRGLVADPFTVTAETRRARLDELAGAIASGDDDEDDDDEDDEDIDSDESDDEDDSESDDSDEDSDDSDDSDSDDADSDDSDSDDDSHDSEERGNRRRRRRGGRRRRRGGNRDDSSDSDESPETSEPTSDDDTVEEPSSTQDDNDSDGDAENEDHTGSSGTTRRRRRRRRSGTDAPDSSKGTGEDSITGIEGSTRMEAKRQRRRENRTAGRRRAPILSEAEFLARRESVDRKLVIRQSEEYTQLAVVEDGILVEHYVDRASATSLIGNVYIGRVQNVLPSMEAAFIDIGRGRNAVLYAGEVDWNSFHVSSEDRKVEKVFKSGQAVLVQVTKDPVGAKGARLTGHVSLPGRYVVYSPGGHLSGISRKLPDSERSRLRDILSEVIGDSESVIVRTAAEGASSEELIRDVNRLKSQWEIIEKKIKGGSAPTSLYSEPELTLRIVRDLFTEDFGALVVQGNGSEDDSFESISAYVAHVAPNLADRVERFQPDDAGHDAFAEYKIDEQIAKALDRKVFLPSGGSLVIDRTEAMTVIDVNTGRFTGSGGNLEATVTSNNLEAAEEVVRQLRLRDIGGIIVVDFIDMVLPSNRELLLRRLVECLGRDRTRHQVAEVTSLGLVQLTRKKIGTGLAEAFTEECEHCHGAGYIRFDEPVDSQAPSDGGDRRSHPGGGGQGASNGGGNRNRSGRGRRSGGSGHGGGGGEKKSD